jgi:hypothetical protein
VVALAAVASPALAPLVKGSREWTLAWAEVAAHDAGLGIAQEPEAGWRYTRSLMSPSGVGIVHEFQSLYCTGVRLHIQATRAYKQMGCGRRDRRRQMLDAHYVRLDGEFRSCERCAEHQEDGVLYQGQSLATGGQTVCHGCALEIVDGGTETDGRATIEMAPLSGEDVEAERASARRLRAAEEERMLAAAGVEREIRIA